MEEIQLDDYKGRDKEYERFLASEQEREEMPLYQKAGLAAVATAGALIAGRRSGAMNRVAKFLDEEATVARQAMKEAFDSEGSLLKNQSMDWVKKAKDTYQARRKELADRYEDTPVLQRRTYDMENYLNQREAVIEQDIPYHIGEGLRLRAIMDDLKQNGIEKPQADMVEYALNRGPIHNLRYGRNSDIEFTLRNEGVESKDVIDLVNETRHKFKAKEFYKTTEEGLRWVQAMQEKVREMTAKQMESLTRKENKYRSQINGERQATVEDILSLHKQEKVEMDPDLMAKVNDAVKYNSTFKNSVFDENLYIKDVNGEFELRDYKAFDNLKRSGMDWFSETLPGGLFQTRDMINMRKAKEYASFRVFETGTVQPMLNAQRGLKNKEMLNEPLMFVGGKFIRLFDEKAVNEGASLEVLNPKRDMYLTSSSFGTIGKISRHTAGLMTEEQRRLFGMDVTRNPVARALDLGAQDKDPTTIQGYTMFSKLFDKEWERNKVNNALKEGIKKREEYFDLKRYLNYNNTGFSPRTMNHVQELLPVRVKDKISELNTNFSRQDDVLKLFREMARDENIKTGYDFNSMYYQFERNPNKVLEKTKPIGDTDPILGGSVKVKTGMDEINQQVSKEFIRQIVEYRGAGIVNQKEMTRQLRDNINKAGNEGKLYRKDQEEADWMINEYMFEKAGQELYKKEAAGIESINELFRGKEEADVAFQNSMRSMTKKLNPIWNKHSTTKPINQIEDEYLAVNKTNFLENIKSVEGWKDIGKQLSLTTGRRNMEDFTTASVFLSNYPVHRLQEALSSLGLGFSDSSMGSPLQTWSSLFLKRMLPTYGAYEGFQYADYKMEDWTGQGIVEGYENHKAQRRLEDAAYRDMYGLNEQAKRERMLKPGIEHFEGMPSIHIPLLGEVGPGVIMNGLLGTFTGQAPLNEADTMTVEETTDDLLYGSEEIRKGRWWAFGSRTAYRGGRVNEFTPNSYRKAHSDWEYSDVTGSGEEQFTNTMFPTFENWFGLKHLMGKTNPYWFEEKHYFDRPYLLTGDLFNSSTPILGDIGNATIGQLIKPTRRMHEAFWGDPQVVTQMVEEGDERPKSPVLTRISPAGRVEYEVQATPVQYGASMNRQVQRLSNPIPIDHKAAGEMPKTEATYIVIDENVEEEAAGNQIVYDVKTNQSIYIPQRVQERYQGDYKKAFADAERSAQEYEGKQVATNPRGLYAPTFEYQKQLDREKLNQLQDPSTMQWKGQELASNILETQGVWNWMIMDEIAGRDPYTDQTVIGKADRAYNAAQEFWEKELGSLGGSMSEIGRRFIRRESGQLDTYNPIQNTMPDWLPGSNYFINFKTGDPYTKVDRGEYRLPGDAYERLNELHSDETGRYGAFDKFKILADVAPWSDEYKYWKDYVEEFIEDSELRKRAADIKRQVSRRKQKYEFEEYRFKDAEVEKMDVTVKRFLDDYTFLTEEMGRQPIRLAGVDARANAEGVLQQHFDVGDKITIGVDPYESERVEDDTYGTMRAVVFQGMNSLNQHLIELGEMKELESDYSSAGVWARFTPGEIKRGARWEKIAHHESALNTKFLQVRSALEEYERDQIYLKDWSTWENFGVTDYLIPSVQRMAGRENTLMSVVSGAFVGGFIGRIFMRGGKDTKVGSILGGLVGLGASMYGKHYEYANGEAYIPERRRKEQEVNEYFDILEYMKYSGLYEQSKMELRHMGYDAERFLGDVEAKRERNKEIKAELEEEKRNLFIDQPQGWEDRRKAINSQLNQMTEEWDEIMLPAPVAQALAYKEEMSKTLYGAEPGDDRMKLMQAFPYKDRSFFNEFAEARPQDRERILELIPENQRRIYQSLWGMEADPRKPLEYYAEKYNIPDANWAGWRPEFSLEDVKVQVVQEEELDMSDFNFWSDDVKASQQVPALPMNYQADEVMFRGYKDVERNIREIMEGQGLRNVQVIARPSQSGYSNVRMDYQEDRSEEIESEFKYHLDRYV